MGRVTRLVRVAGGCATFALFLWACGLESGGTGVGDVPDATTEASTEAGTPDATEITDAGSDVADDAITDAALRYTCDGSSVGDCSSCGDATACVFCTAASSKLVGVCVPSADHCRDHLPDASIMCACVGIDAGPDAGDAGDAGLVLLDPGPCPAPSQVCHDGTDGVNCRTCGEPNTAGETCKGGGQCLGNPLICQL